MKKGTPILKRAGFENIEDLPRTAVGFVFKSISGSAKDTATTAQVVYNVEW